MCAHILAWNWKLSLLLQVVPAIATATVLLGVSLPFLKESILFISQTLRKA